MSARSLNTRVRNTRALDERRHGALDVSLRQEQAREAGGIPTGALTEDVTQTAHGFAVGDVVYFDGSDWLIAEVSEVLSTHDQQVGVVIQVASVNSFTVCTEGIVSLPGLHDHQVYYLGPGGTLTIEATIGSAENNVKRAVLTALTANRVYVHGPQHWGGHDHPTLEVATKTGHGFQPDNIVYRFGGSWALAYAAGARYPLAVVVAVVDANEFVVCWQGEYVRPSGISGDVYYLKSDGGLTATRPATKPYRPILYQLDAHRALMLGLNAIHEHLVDDLGDVDLAGLADGDVLSFDAGTSMWVATPMGGGGAVTLAGDVTGPSGSTSVAKLQGVTLTPGTLVAGMVMYYTGTVWQGEQLVVNAGDLITSNGTLPIRLAIGSAATFLRSNGTLPSWQPIDIGDLGNLFTGRGQLLSRDASNPVRVTIGSSGTYLRSDGSDPSWQTIRAGEFPTIGDAFGNARGTYAVDWQSNRSSVAMVASGTAATISGGRDNTASASDSVVGGGRTNSASASYAVVGGGSSNAASGTSATVAGGNASSATGTSSSVVGGEANLASGAYAVAGGVSCTASGQGSVALGQNSSAAGIACLAIGDHAEAGVTGGAANDYAVALGRSAKAAADDSVAIGRNMNVASSDTGAMTFGYSTIASTSAGAETLSLYFANGVHLHADVFRNTLQILSTRQTDPGDPSGGATVDTNCRLKLIALLNCLRAHGLIG